MLAIRRGDVQTVTQVATSTSCIETHNAEEDWTALHEAAYYGQAACVKALLKGKPMFWIFCIVHNVYKCKFCISLSLRRSSRQQRQTEIAAEQSLLL